MNDDYRHKVEKSVEEHKSEAHYAADEGDLSAEAQAVVYALLALTEQLELVELAVDRLTSWQK